MQENGRVDYIDMAKGFAILVMVFGHTYSTYQKLPLMIWIYSFHMPLFFLTTGVLYGIKEKRGQSLRFKWKNKILTLLLPYFLWNTLYQLFISMLAILGGEPAKDTLVSNLEIVLQLQGSAMWFLPAMFLATCFFFLTIRNRRLNIISICVCGILGVVFPDSNAYLNAVLRSFVGSVFIACGFYGNCFFTRKLKNWIFVVLFIVSLIAAADNGMVSIATRAYNNPFLYFINGCLGTLVIYQFAMHVGKIKVVAGFLRYWGENSVKILCFHGFVIQIIRLCDYKIFGNILPRFGMFEGVFFTILIMTILTILMPVFNKFLNWSFGIKNKTGDDVRW